MATKLIVILALAASTAGVYSFTQKNEDALPCAEGVEIPQIIVPAKGDDAAECRPEGVRRRRGDGVPPLRRVAGLDQLEALLRALHPADDRRRGRLEPAAVQL